MINQKKVLLTIFGLIVVSSMAEADTLVVSGFAPGFGTSSSSDLKLYSAVGQTFVGTMSSEGMRLRTGFLALDPVYRALVNDTPQIISPDTLSAEETKEFRYIPVVTDIDDDEITISYSGLPPEMIQHGDTIVWTPAVRDPARTFTVIASDGSTADTQQVYVAVFTKNSPPVYTAATEDSTNEGESWLYTAEAYDENGDDVVFTFLETPSWMSTQGTATISGIPPEGTRTVRYKIVFDDGRWNDTASITLLVKEINNPPVITSATTVSATEDVAFEYKPTIADPDNIALDVWFSSLPVNWRWESQVTGGLVLDSVLKGMPLDFAGTAFWVHASDGEHADSQEVIVNVTSVEEPPRIVSNNHVKALLGGSGSYIARATDPEMQTVTFDFDALPPWCGATNDTTVSINASGFFTELQDSFKVVATDAAGLKDSIKVHIDVIETNEPPYVTGATTVQALEGDTFTYTIDVVDPDDSKWSFRYTRKPSWLNSVVTEGTFAGRDSLWGIPDGTNNIAQFVVEISDGGDSVYTHSVLINITPVDDPPRFTSVPDTQVYVGEIYSYRARAIDPEQTLVTYSLVKGPAEMNIDSSTGQVSWEPETSDAGRNDSITIRAHDLSGQTSEQSFVLTVKIDGRPRVTLGSIGPSVGSVDIPFALSDADNDSLQIKLFFRGVAGWKEVPSGNIQGRLGGYGSGNYQDTITWLAAADIPDFNDTTRIQLAAYDMQTAEQSYPVVSNLFKLNTTPHVTISSPSPSPSDLHQAVQCTVVSVSYSGPKLSAVTVNKNTVRIAGKQTGVLQIDSILVTDTSIAVHLAGGPRAGDSVTVTLDGSAIQDLTGKVIGNDYTWGFNVAYLGDFDSDGYAARAGDLSLLAGYWRTSALGASDPIVEIGPATGTAPYLTPNPDGVFDHFDISVFLDMWRWKLGQAGQAKALAKVRIREGVHRVDLKTSSLRSSLVTCELAVQDVEELVACEYTIRYDPEAVAMGDIGEGSLLGADGAQTLVLTETPAPGQAQGVLVRLSSGSLGISGDGLIASLPVKRKTGAATKLMIEYELVGPGGITIESGASQIDLAGVEAHELTVKSVAAAPTPSRVASGARSFEFIEGASLYQLPSSMSGGTSIIMELDNPATGARQLSGEAIILDRTGAVVVRTGRCDLSGLVAQGATRLGVFWDGRNGSGRPMPRGIYRAVVRWTCNGVPGVKVLALGVE